MKFRTIRQCRTFQLIELLIVISILAALASLLQPTLGKMIERSHQLICSNNLKDIVFSMFLYVDDHSFFPAAESQPNNNNSWNDWTWDEAVILEKESHAVQNPRDIEQNTHIAPQMVCPSIKETSGPRNIGLSGYKNHSASYDVNVRSGMFEYDLSSEINYHIPSEVVSPNSTFMIVEYWRAYRLIGREAPGVPPYGSSPKTNSQYWAWHETTKNPINRSEVPILRYSTNSFFDGHVEFQSNFDMCEKVNNRFTFFDN